MKKQKLSARCQSARAYLGEALEALADLIEDLQELEEEGQELPCPAGTLSQIERAHSLTETALLSLEKAKL